MSFRSTLIGPSTAEEVCLKPEEAVLSLSTNSVYLHNLLSFEFIELSWNLQQELTNQLDWIGLFEVDECNPLLYLDYKSFGVFGQQSIKWKLTQDIMPNKQAQLRFRYYSGLTGTVRASSPPFLMYTKGQVVITSVKCKNIKQSKHPYFVKVYYGNLICHKTDLSNNGVWPDLNFNFPSDLSQELLLVVKERLWSGSRTIGEANIKIAEMVNTNKNGELAFVLRTRNNVQFSYQLSIQWRFIPNVEDKVSSSTVEMSPKLVPPKCPDTLNGNVPSTSNCQSLNSSVYSNGSSDMQSSFSGQSITKLPKGWQIRVDKYGRLIYVDHINKRTTWNCPMILERESAHTGGTVRRTVFTSETNNNEEPSKTTKSNQNAIDFLQHSEFSTTLHRNQEALKMFNESSYLKHIVGRLRKNRSNFQQFEKNREFVTFLNMFADTTQPLPHGWEIARSKDSNNQRLFIDHKNKIITPIDPRLPVKRKKRAQSEPPAPLLDINSNSLQYQISQRTEEISERICRQMPEIAPRLCRKLQNISALGESALEVYANDLDVVCAISAMEHETEKLKVTTDFDIKVDYFYNSLQRAGYGQNTEKIRLNLRRSHLLSDAFDKLLNADPSMLRKYTLVVNFDGEEGLDFGGVSKEMFYLISRELFNPYYGLFEYSACDNYTVEISAMSKFVDHYLQWFELAGRLIGLSLIHRCLIDTFFTKAFYKMLIGSSYLLEDLKAMDNQFYNSLKWIRENTITSDMDLTFSATTDVCGDIVEAELLPGGKSLLVTDQNKEEFISLMVRFRIERNVNEQMKAVIRGLYSIIPRNYLAIFNEDQLEKLLAGTIEINLEDWRQHTEYKGGYSGAHVVIKWFWQLVYEMQNETRLKLLQFITGTQSIPIQGFAHLRGSNGAVKLFTVEKWGNVESLPRTHSCFNRLDLPCYPTKECLKHKLLFAVNESSSYGIE